jgi:hypothetical protein
MAARGARAMSAFVTELSGKRIELLKEAFPSVSTVGFMNNLGNPVAPPQWEATRAVASQLRLTAELFDVRSEADIVRAFSTMVDKRLGALSVGIEPAICRWNSRPSSSFWSICAPPKRSASTYRRHCSRAPTR